jgi:hypothetical protein
MKRNTLLAVGLSLFLLSGVVSNGQFQTSGTIAADKKSFIYEDYKKTSELNAFTNRETKSQRKVARRKTPKYSGRWKGTLYQPDGPLWSKFNFTVRLYQKGKKVTGFSRISIIDEPEYYGLMRLKGTIRRNRLSFTEIKITQENTKSGSGWCIKSGKLKLAYLKGKLTLKGNWQGPNCSPGTILLRKVSRK